MGSLVSARGLLSSGGAQAPGRTGSVVAACRLSSCGTWALEHAGLAASRHLESCFPARDRTVLEGRFLTTGPPGKSHTHSNFYFYLFIYLFIYFFLKIYFFID